MFHADGSTEGQTDGETNMTTLIVAFRNFANVPKRVLEVQTYTER